MLVIEALKLSALLVEGDLDIDGEDIDLWLKCYNLIEQELATDYFPILEVDKANIATRRYPQEKPCGSSFPSEPEPAALPDSIPQQQQNQD